MTVAKRYLGDGVYANFDDYHVVLTVENGVAVTDTVYLDDRVLDALLKYVADLAAYAKARKAEAAT